MTGFFEKRNKLFSKPFLLTAITIFSIFSSAFLAFAAGPFFPGQTLDPDCAPGDVDCTVEQSDSVWTVVGSDISYTLGEVEVGDFLASNATTTSLYVGNLSGPLRAQNGLVSTGNINLATEVTGVLPIVNGGYADSLVNAFIHASSTIAKTYSANTWTNTQSIDSSLFSLTGLSNGCLQISSNIITSTGSSCGSGNIGGSISSGQVAFGTSLNTIAGNDNFVWDSVNSRLGIGTDTPVYKLDLYLEQDDQHLNGIRSIVTGIDNTTTQYNAIAGRFEASMDGRRNYGIYSIASGSNLGNIGIYASSSSSGVRNWSGYFGSGNVGIENSIYLGVPSISPAENINIQIAFTDAGLGFERISENVLGVYTNNVERLRFTDNGTTFVATTTHATTSIASLILPNLSNQNCLGTNESGVVITGTCGGGGISGSISANQVAFGSGSDTISGNSSFVWDSVNSRLGVGTDTPEYTLDIYKSVIDEDVNGIRSIVTGTDSINYTAIAGRFEATMNTGLRNFGIYSSASNGGNNWAGFFADGDVGIQNKLKIGVLHDMETPNTINRQLTFTDDGLGFDRISENVLGVYTNDVERARFTNSGLSIGTNVTLGTLNVGRTESISTTGGRVVENIFANLSGAGHSTADLTVRQSGVDSLPSTIRNIILDNTRFAVTDSFTATSLIGRITDINLEESTETISGDVIGHSIRMAFTKAGSIGLRVDMSDLEGAGYSIYSEGGYNYFGGNVGLGASAPTRQLAFTDNGLGFERISSNVLGVYANNSEVARFTTSGLTMSGDISMGNNNISFGNSTSIAPGGGTGELNITGSIVSATWNGGTIAVDRGGTGQTTLAANKLLVGNGTSGILSPTNLHWDNSTSRLGLSAASPTVQLALTDNGLGFSRFGTNQLGVYTSNTLRALFTTAELDMYLPISYSNSQTFLRFQTGSGTLFSIDSEGNTDIRMAYESGSSVKLRFTPSQTFLPNLPTALGSTNAVCYNTSTGELSYDSGSLCSGAESPFLQLWKDGGLVEEIEFFANLNAVGKAGWQSFPLINYDTSSFEVKIENRKPETDYIDNIRIVLYGSYSSDQNGISQYHILKPSIDELKEKDGEYIVLEDGESINLTFEEIPEDFVVYSATFQGYGYYIPHTADMYTSLFDIDQTITRNQNKSVSVSANVQHKENSSLKKKFDLVIDKEAVCKVGDSDEVCNNKLEEQGQNTLALRIIDFARTNNIRVVPSSHTFPTGVANDSTSSGISFVSLRTGEIGIGTSEPEYKLHVVGDVAATGFVNISSNKFKKDINYLSQEELDSYLDIIKDLRVASYRYKDEESSNPLRIGLIAEDSPSEILSVNGEGVDLYKLSVLNLAGIQALQEKMKSIEFRLSSIEDTLEQFGGGFSISSVFEGFGIIIQDGFAYFKNLFAETLTIGSESSPAGVTLFDEITGEPYCLKISGGSILTLLGRCEDLVNNQDEASNNSGLPNDSSPDNFNEVGDDEEENQEHENIESENEENNDSDISEESDVIEEDATEQEENLVNEEEITEEGTSEEYNTDNEPEELNEE